MQLMFLKNQMVYVVYKERVLLCPVRNLTKTMKKIMKPGRKGDDVRY